MIKGTCFTNDDDLRTKTWPSMFVAVPVAGDLVEAKDKTTARVVRITHTMSDYGFVSSIDGDGEPMIHVEIGPFKLNS